MLLICEPFHEIDGVLDTSFRLCHIVIGNLINFKDEGDHNIEKDEHHNDKVESEEVPWECAIIESAIDVNEAIPVVCWSVREECDLP